jgi:predicted transcriptional regulator
MKKVHRGRILEEAVKASGIPVTSIKTMVGVSRRTIYVWFEKEDLEMKHMAAVGNVIGVDFAQYFTPDEIKMKDLVLEGKPAYTNASLEKCKEEVQTWKDKYIQAIEEINILKQQIINIKKT